MMMIEYRISNKEPQNYEVFTSTFDILCSTFTDLGNFWLSGNLRGTKLA